MKATLRLTIGLISSLLLSAGFSQAAVRLDPLTHQLKKGSILSTEDPNPTGPCVMPCNYCPRPVEEKPISNTARNV